MTETTAPPPTTRLAALADRRAYPARGPVDRRWGQLLRSAGDVARLLDAGQARGVLVPLRDLAEIRGGVPTRANAYFLVTELPFGQEPARLRLTRADYQRVAVVLDGLDVPARIERTHLRPALKGPEALLTPTQPAPGALRVVNVDADEATLRRDRHTGILAYLRRGREVDYSHNTDALKGGVPAERSKVRGRRPHWYSLGLPPATPEPRLVFPEHVDQRYPVTLLGAEHQDLAVIDKLYVAIPRPGVDAAGLLAAMSSMLTWAQLELRGRTPLGQGVLAQGSGQVIVDGFSGWPTRARGNG